MKSYNSKSLPLHAQVSVDSVLVVRPKLRIALIKNAPLIFVSLLIPPLTILFTEPLFRLVLYGVGILLLLCMVYSLFQLRYTSWTITPSQLIYKRGVLATKTDYTELYRVNDYAESQSLAEKILRIKRIVIHSTDKSNPEMSIYGIENHADLVNYIRTFVEQSKRNRNVYEIANY